MPAKESIIAFCKRIIETKGNASTKDAKECGIPFGYWFEWASVHISNEQRVVNAKKVLAKYGVD